jgi:hypothetical protein
MSFRSSLAGRPANEHPVPVADDDRRSGLSPSSATPYRSTSPSRVVLRQGGTSRASDDLSLCPCVPVPTGTHRKPSALADKSSLSTHGNVSSSRRVTVRTFARRYSDPSAALHQQAQPGPYKTCPRRAGRTPGWPTPRQAPARWVGWVRHPADLSEGYHAAPRGQAWQPQPAVRLCG